MGLFNDALKQHQKEAAAEREVYRSIEVIRKSRPDIYRELPHKWIQWADRYRRMHSSKSHAGQHPSRAK